MRGIIALMGKSCRDRLVRHGLVSPTADQRVLHGDGKANPTVVNLTTYQKFHAEVVVPNSLAAIRPLSAKIEFTLRAGVVAQVLLRCEQNLRVARDKWLPRPDLNSSR